MDNKRFRSILRAYPERAIKMLYDRYYKNLLNLAKSLTHDQEAAEDIVQETFLHVWTKYRKLSEYHELPIEHYLVRVVKFKSITHYKQTKKLILDKIKYVNGHSFEIKENTIETKLIETEIRMELRQVINTFPKRERECLLMKIDQEMTTSQIAASLGVTIKAVERSLTSARKRLRKYWLKHHENPKF